MYTYIHLYVYILMYILIFNILYLENSDFVTINIYFEKEIVTNN